MKVSTVHQVQPFPESALHSFPQCGLSPAWTNMWHTGVPFWVKAFSHWFQMYCLSPWVDDLSSIWICWWRLKEPERVKAFPYFLYVNRFSPVWILMCFFRLPDWVDSDPHSSQLYSFSLVQILRRLAGLSLTDRVNSLLILYTNYYNMRVGYYCFIGTVKVEHNMFLLVIVVSNDIFWLLTCYN